MRDCPGHNSQPYGRAEGRAHSTVTVSKDPRGVLGSLGGGSLTLAVGPALSTPLGPLHHLGCSVGLAAALPCSPPLCNRPPIRPNPFSGNKKTKVGPLRKGLLFRNIYPAVLMNYGDPSLWGLTGISHSSPAHGA